MLGGNHNFCEKNPCIPNYALVKMNSAPPPLLPQVYDRGLSDYTGDSDKDIAFRHHSDITDGGNIHLWLWDF